MRHTISLDDISQHLVSITDFRRNAGSYLDRIRSVGSYVLVRDGIPLVKMVPIEKTDTRSVEKKLRKLKQLTGGFHFKKSLSPKEFNKLLDDRYAEMLPR